MDYFEREGISQSYLKKWLNGRKFAEIETVETDEMVFGSAFHSLMNGDDETNVAVFNETELIKEIGGSNPRATKVYKEKKREFWGANPDKHIVTDTEFCQIKKMRDVLFADPLISKIVNLPNSRGEVEIFTEMEVCGVTLTAKGKADQLSEPPNPWILDWKKYGQIPTPHKIRSVIMYEGHHDFQAAWYYSLYKTKYGAEPNMLWCYIMDKEPYEYLLVDMSDFLESGFTKISKALDNMISNKSFREIYGDEFGICRLKREF